MSCSNDKSEKRDIKHIVAFEWRHVNIDYDYIMAQHKSHASEEILPEALYIDTTRRKNNILFKCLNVKCYNQCHCPGWLGGTGNVKYPQYN